MNKIMSSVIVFRLSSVSFSRIVPISGTYKFTSSVSIATIKHREYCSQNRERIEDAPFKPSYITVSDTLSTEESKSLSKDMIVLDNFLSESEEKTLFEEVGPYMERLHYEYDHWDNAIHGFRETERLHWTEPSMNILDRVRKAAFPEGKPQLKHVHVLDLSADGYIKPHIDSVKFCGDTIAGLSLLSDCVMRLVQEKNEAKVADVLLKRRSLYIMKDSARYNYTHQILGKELSKFNTITVPRDRRISVICRSEVL